MESYGIWKAEKSTNPVNCAQMAPEGTESDFGL